MLTGACASRWAARKNRGKQYVCHDVLLLLCCGNCSRVPRLAAALAKGFQKQIVILTSGQCRAERARSRTDPCIAIKLHHLFTLHSQARDCSARPLARVDRHANRSQMGGGRWPRACAWCLCSLSSTPKGMVFQVSRAVCRVTANCTLKK